MKTYYLEQILKLDASLNIKQDRQAQAEFNFFVRAYEDEVDKQILIQHHEHCVLWLESMLNIVKMKNKIVKKLNLHKTILGDLNEK